MISSVSKSGCFMEVTNENVKMNIFFNQQGILQLDYRL